MVPLLGKAKKYYTRHVFFYFVTYENKTKTEDDAVR